MIIVVFTSSLHAVASSLPIQPSLSRSPSLFSSQDHRPAACGCCSWPEEGTTLPPTRPNHAAALQIHTVHKHIVQTTVLQLVTDAVGLEKDAPNRDEKIAEVRQGINTWVAKYRRDDTFAGRPSYS